jgi:hypothetical protein
MEKFLKNQQIPLTQVIDPNTGQAYYAPQNVVYDDKVDSGPTYLRDVIVDQALTASYFDGRVVSASYALTASYVSGSSSNTISSSYALSASYAANGGVTQLLAGPNISLSPTNGLGQVTVSATLSGSTIFNTATGSYGSFYDTTTQTNPVANIARSMSLNSTDISNGVSISGSTNPFNTYIKTENAGIYDIQFSAQVDKTDGGSDDVIIWLRKNGIDLTDTATTLTLPTNNSKVVAAWNWFVTSANGDYYQIIWRSADTDLRLLAEPISADHPGIPSVIVTANRVDQFLSNTGSFSGSFTGVFTGSFSGSGTITSASFAGTASYVNPLTQSVLISGSLNTNNTLYVTGSSVSIGTSAYTLMNYGQVPQLYVNNGTFLDGVTQFPTTLRVIATGGGIQFAQQSAPSTNSILFFGNDSNGVYYGNYASLGVRFLINGSAAMTLASTTGNALIGTTTDAGYKLDVAGTGRFTGNLTVSTGGVGTNTFNGNINYLFANQNNVYGIIDLQNAAGQSELLKATATYSYSSGTTAQYIFSLRPNYNFTSTYSGIVRGLYYNPTLTSMTGVTHRAIETTSGDVIFGGNTRVTITGSLTVITGSSIEFQVNQTGVKIGNAPTDSHSVTGSFSISSSAGTNSAIYAYKSGSTVLDIQGSQGQLFSVIDALSGSLMSVNDVSGLPILEVFSDDRVVMGTYGAPALTVTGSTLIATGSLLGTASYATTALSASYAPVTPTFPYTGSALITGSLSVTGSLNVTGGISATDYLQSQYIATSASVVVMKNAGISYITDFSTGGAGDLRFYYGGGGGWSYNWYTNNTKRVSIQDSGLYITNGGFDSTGTGRFGSNVTITGSASNSLLVKGSGTTSATTALLIQNSSANASLTVLDSTSNGYSQVTAGTYTDGTPYSNTVLRASTLASARDITIGSDGTLNGYSSRLNFTNYYSNGGQGNISNLAGYIRTSISQYTSLGGQPSGRGTLLLGVYDTDFSPVSLTPFDVVSIGKYATTISGSLTVTGGITGSLLGTASYATTALSASYAPSTPAFPYTGSALITGSLGITGSLTVSGSSTFTNIGPAIFSGSITQNASTASFGGVVGIGTTTPSATLEVNGTSLFQNDITAYSRMDMYGTLYMYNNITSLSGNIQISDGYAIGDRGTGNNRIEFYSNKLSFFGNGTEALRIVGPTQNVLIGTTTDAGYKLDVRGTSRFANDIYLATTSGNVGIRTTSPSYQLDVNGSINTNTSLTVTGSLKIKNGTIPVMDTTVGNLYDVYGNASVNFGSNQLLNYYGINAVNWGSYYLIGSSGNISVDWDNRYLADTAGTQRLKWTTSGAQVTGSLTISQGSLTVGNITSTPSNENSLNVYPPLAGGTGEGGQILLAASGGLYTSASMLDTWQDQFRILRGSNTGGSNAGLVYVNLQSGNTQFTGAVTASAYSGLPNDYLYATRSGSSQTVGSSWANTDIIFNNVAVSKGISFNTSTGVASLTGGKVYRVTARLAWGAAAAYNLQFSCFTSGNTQIGPTTEIIQSSNGTSNISDGTLEFIYAPSSNTDIKIRCTNNNTALSGETIRADLNTQFIIQQIA